ncbi:MAG: ferredoxin subunit of nitrite reductase and ring-hydroxylating dioxygenase [Myxococcales bacterium]|nr:ferredoxin subunit of nitrite reductase and ring-hydroxylating dioxygenase [Myxococcales bacterium]
MLFRKWRSVAKVGDVAPGAVIPVTVDGIDLALGRDGERYFATQRTCVHRAGDLSQGTIRRGELVCPQHGWRFSTETGRLVSVMDHCLTVYDVRVRGDQIEVDPVPRKRGR